MSGPVRHRRTWRRLARRAAQVALVLALPTTLALALQVRQVRVVGAHRFPAREVEAALRSALGTPTIAARAEQLRTIVRSVPWVADASVRVSLDGVVTCTLTERAPAAIGLDAGERRLLDAEGRVLGAAEPGAGLLELDGFGAVPEERAAALAAVATLESRWGGALERIERVGPADVALHFKGTATTVVADPAAPENLDAAQRVLRAWAASGRPAPVRVDVRVAARAAVLAAPQPAAEAGS